MRAETIALICLASLAGTHALPAQKTAKPEEWGAFTGGWTLKTRLASFYTTLDKKELTKISTRIAELTPAYERHFGSKLKRGWTFVVFADRKEFEKYAKETTKGRLGVQGQCFRDQKILTVLNAKRYGWNTTLSHEYAHAYYHCNGPIWLREGIASLVEVAEVKTTGRGKSKKVQMTIPVNPPRLRGLRIYQSKKHYLSIQNLVRGEKEADGYGYSYEHGWSLHFFLYSRDPDKYRAFLKKVRKKTGRDVSQDLSRAFNLGIEDLDAQWRKFTADLKP